MMYWSAGVSNDIYGFCLMVSDDLLPRTAQAVSQTIDSELATLVLILVRMSPKVWPVSRCLQGLMD